MERRCVFRIFYKKMFFCKKARSFDGFFVEIFKKIFYFFMDNYSLFINYML